MKTNYDLQLSAAAVRAYCIRPMIKGEHAGSPLQFARWIFLHFCVFAFLPIFAQSVGDTKTFTDTRDGQAYKAVFMPDNRWWMAENLKYRNGLDNPVFSTLPIPTNTNALQNTYYCPGHGPIVVGVSATQSDPLACEYWGALYPWWSAMTVRNSGQAVYATDTVGSQGICPPGWHLPSDKEWGIMFDSVERKINPAFALLHATTTVINGSYGSTATNKIGSYLKSSSAQSGAIKEYDPAWSSGASTDNFGFNIIPAGYREQNGSSYASRGTATYFWTSTKSATANYANYRGFSNTVGQAGRWDGFRSYGLSVRCMEGEYFMKPILLPNENQTFCNGSNTFVNVENSSNYSSYIFNVNGVDNAAVTTPYMFVSSITNGTTIKVKGLSAEGWTGWSNLITVKTVDCSCTSTSITAPELAINTAPSTAVNAVLTTTASCANCVVDWYPTASGGAAYLSNTKSFTSSNYTYYAAARDLSTGCTSADRAIVSIIPYSGAAAQRGLIAGTYRMECWGAQGGQAYGSPGYGGYTKGTLALSELNSLIVHVGQQGLNVVNSKTGGAGGYNGGGRAGNAAAAACVCPSGGGGGASDIRLMNSDNSWNNQISLRSRIMVAGAGGGSANNQRAGDGGFQGGASYYTYIAVCGGASGNRALGATQTTGNAFGIGGNGVTPTCTGSCAGEGTGGGGGGYWGGTAYAVTCPTNTYSSGGGGGSSYISGHSGCNAINSSGTHTGQPNHYSGLVFSNTSMASGVRSGNGTVVIIRTGN